MKDNLENIDQVFRDNQDGFNKAPTGQAWRRLENLLDQTEIVEEQPAKSNRIKWLAAAALVGLLCIPILTYIGLGTKDNHPRVSENISIESTNEAKFKKNRADKATAANEGEKSSLSKETIANPPEISEDAKFEESELNTDNSEKNFIEKNKEIKTTSEVEDRLKNQQGEKRKADKAFTEPQDAAAEKYQTETYKAQAKDFDSNGPQNEPLAITEPTRKASNYSEKEEIETQSDDSGYSSDEMVSKSEEKSSDFDYREELVENSNLDEMDGSQGPIGELGATAPGAPSVGNLMLDDKPSEMEQDQQNEKGEYGQEELVDLVDIESTKETPRLAPTAAEATDAYDRGTSLDEIVVADESISRKDKTVKSKKDKKSKNENSQSLEKSKFSCYDLNENSKKDVYEDFNLDGKVNNKDCEYYSFLSNNGNKITDTRSVESYSSNSMQMVNNDLVLLDWLIGTWSNETSVSEWSKIESGQLNCFEYAVSEGDTILTRNIKIVQEFQGISLVESILLSEEVRDKNFILLNISTKAAIFQEQISTKPSFIVFKKDGNDKVIIEYSEFANKSLFLKRN